MSTAENSLGWKKENRGFDMNRPFATIVIIYILLLLLSYIQGSEMFRCRSNG
jgi:hypothetical protein